VRSGAAVVCLTLAFLVLVVRSSPVEAAKAVDGVVNLNTAPAEILALLPGIGPAKAVAILAYRKRRPFRTVDELVRIKGVGRKMVRRLRIHLAVAGPTTATATTAKATPAAVSPPKPVPLPAHPPHPSACPAAPPRVHPTHPAPGQPRLHARLPDRGQSVARPWRAPCLNPA
jgi:competence ComEA-like helix-hairpin-helix protein